MYPVGVFGWLTLYFPVQVCSHRFRLVPEPRYETTSRRILVLELIGNRFHHPGPVLLRPNSNRVSGASDDTHGRRSLHIIRSPLLPHHPRLDPSPPLPSCRPVTARSRHATDAVEAERYCRPAFARTVIDVRMTGAVIAKIAGSPPLGGIVNAATRSREFHIEGAMSMNVSVLRHAESAWDRDRSHDHDRRRVDSDAGIAGVDEDVYEDVYSSGVSTLRVPIVSFCLICPPP